LTDLAAHARKESRQLPHEAVISDVSSRVRTEFDGNSLREDLSRKIPNKFDVVLTATRDELSRAREEKAQWKCYISTPHVR